MLDNAIVLLCKIRLSEPEFEWLKVFKQEKKQLKYEKQGLISFEITFCFKSRVMSSSLILYSSYKSNI